MQYIFYIIIALISAVTLYAISRSFLDARPQKGREDFSVLREQMIKMQEVLDRRLLESSEVMRKSVMDITG